MSRESLLSITNTPSRGLKGINKKSLGRQQSKLLGFLVLVAFLVLAAPGQGQAYIGPGAGFAVVGSFLVMFTALLSGALALFTWPIRYIVRAIRGRRVFARSRVKRFVILGLDGVDEQQIKKELAIGSGFMRVSARRPGWHFANILLHPWEKPFVPDSVVQSVSIDYPDRISRTSGTDWWVIYFFVASLAFALIFKLFLKVRI